MIENLRIALYAVAIAIEVQREVQRLGYEDLAELLADLGLLLA